MNNNKLDSIWNRIYLNIFMTGAWIGSIINHPSVVNVIGLLFTIVMLVNSWKIAKKENNESNN